MTVPAIRVCRIIVVIHMRASSRSAASTLAGSFHTSGANFMSPPFSA
jgi:hypothetical protein